MKKRVSVFLLVLFLVWNGFSQEVSVSTDDTSPNAETVLVNETVSSTEAVSFDQNVLSEVNKNDSIVNWFTPKAEWSLLGQAIITNYHNFVQYTIGLDVVLKSDMKELQNTVGLRFDFKKFDVSYWGVYAPTLWNRFSPGITLINHLSFYYDEYLEFDFLVGPHIAYKPFKWFDFFFDFMYQFKSTTIYAIADKVPSVISNCPAFNLTFNFHIIPELSIDLTFSSYNFFKYYLFFSPNMTLGLKYSANEHYDARLFAEIQYVDMFTLSANLNRFTTGASVCWRF